MIYLLVMNGFVIQVHQLLMELCDETSVAELQLKVSTEGFLGGGSLIFDGPFLRK